jgi:hypothetical protein
VGLDGAPTAAVAPGGVSVGGAVLGKVAGSAGGGAGGTSGCGEVTCVPQAP